MYLLYGYFGLKRTFCPVNKRILALTDKMSFQFYLRIGIMGKKYPNITASWTTHWAELSTFFKYPDSVRKLIYTTKLAM
jgi:hypothetical protein